MLECLLEAGAEFVIVGAHALAVHQVVRATGDIDVFVRSSRDNAARVIEALERFGAPVDAHGVTQSDFEKPEQVYQMGLPPCRIDVLTSISGVTFDDAWRTRVMVRVDGMNLPFLGLDALRANKAAAGRPKDLADLALLDELGGAEHDDR